VDGLKRAISPTLFNTFSVSACIIMIARSFRSLSVLSSSSSHGFKPNLKSSLSLVVSSLFLSGASSLVFASSALFRPFSTSDNPQRTAASSKPLMPAVDQSKKEPSTTLTGPLATSEYLGMAENEYFSPKRPLRFLVPLDFSQPSFRALKIARQMMQYERGDELVILHVPLTPPPNSAFDEPLMFVNKETRREIMDRAEKHLDVVRVLLQDIVGRFSIEIAEPVSDPRETLLLRCEKREPNERCDIVVCGQRGGSHLVSMLLGSVTTHLVHSSPIPVLVVR